VQITSDLLRTPGRATNNFLGFQGIGIDQGLKLECNLPGLMG
jgi:hypothetical protein